MLKAGGTSSPVHHCQPDQFFQSGEHIPRSQTACQSSPHWQPEIIYKFRRCSLEITSGMSRPRARTAVAIRMFVLPSENWASAWWSWSWCWWWWQWRWWWLHRWWWDGRLQWRWRTCSLWPWLLSPWMLPQAKPSLDNFFANAQSFNLWLIANVCLVWYEPVQLLC